MNFSKIVALSALVVNATGFSMISPHFTNFPKRFGSYLKELDEIFEPDWPATFFERTMEEMKGSSETFHAASPRYEVTERKDKFEMAMELPGYTMDDVEVSVKAGGRLLSVRGAHKMKDKGHAMSSRFQQSFSLDPSIEVDKLTAEFHEHDGTLRISAPRVNRLPASRQIPIHMLKEGKAKRGSKRMSGKDEPAVTP
eukprot:976117_1